MSAPNCRVAIPKGNTVPHETYEIINPSLVPLSYRSPCASA